jgi:hypothetical protein
MPDSDQLEFAAAERRIMVTFDADYLQLAASGVAHSGIAFCHATKYTAGQLLQVLLMLHGVMDCGSMQNQVEFL